MFVTNTAFGGAGFSVPSGGEYLKTATGYPLTLEKTLARPPESITVSGNTGGVGDMTANLFNKTIVYKNPAELSRDYAVYLEAGEYSFKINSFTNVNTYRLCFKMWTSTSEATTDGITILSSSMSFYIKSGGYQSVKDSSSKSFFIRFTLTEARYIAFGLNGGSTSSASKANDVMLVEGSYTAATMPPYEPYGYKIPIIFSDGTTGKTINLYSFGDLVDGEFLTVNPKAKTATLTDGTSVADLQDWEQDFTIPKADELTVTAGTEREPEGMEIVYRSRKKE